MRSRLREKPWRRFAALRALLFFSCALALLAIGCDATPPPRATPNIVLIIGDDHGYRDYGFMGSDRFLTPNLDSLARGGTVFSHAFVTASTCGPSLRSLATGLHPIQWRHRKAVLRQRGTPRIYDTEIVEFDTLPGLLSTADYRSFQAGKFFGGSFDLAGFSDGMNTPGSDLRFGGPGKWFGRRTGIEPVEHFLDDVGEAPFFLWFAPMLPHRPFNAEARHRAPYEGQQLPRSALGYLANVNRFDDLIGELLRVLDERGLREDTLIVYLSDNGWDQPMDTHFHVSSWDSDGPKGKRSMYELGFRTPLVFNWPGAIESGVVRSELVSSVDLFPSLLGFAGVSAGIQRPGHDLRPLLGGRGSWSRDAVVTTSVNVRSDSLAAGAAESGADIAASSIRTADWAYIDYESPSHQALFDMRDDPDQERNLIDAHPEVAERLGARIRDWKRKMIEDFSETLERPAYRPAPDDGKTQQGPVGSG